MKHKSKNIKPVTIKETNSEVPKWAIIAVLALTALIYSKVFQNGFVSLDDDDYILNNPLIRSFNWDGIKTIFFSFFAGNYHPFVLLSFLVEYKLFGLNPLPYHLTNVLLHLLNILLVYKLSEQLSGKKMTALVVSLLFAVHPMHVESVAWATERKDVLYTLFYLSSLLLYLQYLKSGFRLKNYSGVLLLFTASLFSKSAAVTLPVLLIAIDIYKGRKIDSKSLLEKIPFFMLSLFFGILAIMSQKADGALNDISFTYNFIERIFLFTYAISFYIVKFVAPFNLSAMHYIPELAGGALPWLYYASLPFLLLLGWLLLRKTSLRKEMIFGFGFFLITISVMLQIFPVGKAITSERYSYVSYIGLFYILGQYISSIHIKDVRNIVMGLFSISIIVFSIQTWNRIAVWKNGETLFNDIIKKYPDNYNGYCLRGLEKFNNGNFNDAIEDYNKAILLKPDFSETYYSRGRAYSQEGDTKLAIDDYNQAIRLKPDWAETYNYRGKAYYQSGNSQLALEDYNKAILLKPEWAAPYNNRGLLYYQLNNATSAIQDFNKAIMLEPGNAESYGNRGLAYSRNGDVNAALLDFDRAALLNPEFSEAAKTMKSIAYFNRGVSRLSLKDTIGACNDWKIAKDLGNEKAAVQLKMLECE